MLAKYCTYVTPRRLTLRGVKLFKNMNIYEKLGPKC